MIDEARLDPTDSGLTPATDGWFVVNAADAAWVTSETFGSGCRFENRDALPFTELGIGIRVLAPGQSNGYYHAESAQEDFLVLAGECLLLVEGEERHLRAWDFVHCPGGTAHIFVGAGDGPCAILMAGARPDEGSILYPVSEPALRHKAGVETETPSPDEAYAGIRPPTSKRPASWDELPWS
jgi:uncharacterized cupin superfamily protein